MQNLRIADSIIRNAGLEVVQAMSKSFRRMKPERTIQTVRQYLEFRHDNAGASYLLAILEIFGSLARFVVSYVLAAVKFSICSGIDLSDPRLARFLNMFKDHLAIINDMASYDKEKRDFEDGSSKDLINVVDNTQLIFPLSDIDSAKALAYTYQVRTETWMTE